VFVFENGQVRVVRSGALAIHWHLTREEEAVFPFSHRALIFRTNAEF
jgi:hypothetical protein